MRYLQGANSRYTIAFIKTLDITTMLCESHNIQLISNVEPSSH